MKNKPHTAAHEVTGTAQPEALSSNVREIISRRKSLSVEELTSGIFSGQIAALSRAITLIESSRVADQKKAALLISACLPKAGKSIRIGITGVPGVGKSTFIEALGKYLTAQGKRVAVLAVDPSSSISRGSILGDKTRMEELVKDEHAYIRPSAAGDSLGGVAAKTRESITLCEAFGFDVIIIETVGVGQSETAVHGMVDFFLLLKIAGAGDELQGIKRGIMEMADAVVINKADGENRHRAGLAKSAFARALTLFPPKESGWVPVVSTCSAIEKEGMEEIWSVVQQFEQQTKLSCYFERHRTEQDLQWFYDAIHQALKQRFYQDRQIERLIERQKKLLLEQRISAFAAAQEVLNTYFGS